jgi:hypothetical protein
MKSSGEDVDGSATRFYALLLPPERYLSSPSNERRTSLRKGLQSIVMSVMVVIVPISSRFLCDGSLLKALSTVTPIVIEKSPSLCGSLPAVTLMTLMTVNCSLILDKGCASLDLVGPYSFSLTRRTRRWKEKSPLPYGFRTVSSVGFLDDS